MVRRSHPINAKNLTDQRGFSVLETLMVMALAAILTGIAVANLKEFDDPLVNGAAQTASFLKQVRAKAISNTSAYIISAASPTRVVTEFADTCSATPTTNDPETVLDLPDGASFPDDDWEFCFDSRGMPDSNIEIALEELSGANLTVEVLLGGAIRIQ